MEEEKQEPKRQRKYKKRSKLLKNLQDQLEFYFGDSNLQKDRFLQKKIQENPEGYVPVEVIASFNRMKCLTEDRALIVKAMKNSSLLEVSPDEQFVRRATPLLEPSNVDERTLYVENLPLDVSHEMLRTAFKKYGNVTYIRFKNKQAKGFAFIEFSSTEEASDALQDFTGAHEQDNPLNVESIQVEGTRKRKHSSGEIKTAKKLKLEEASRDVDTDSSSMQKETKPLRVISKMEWMALKKIYKELQKKQMSQLKETMKVQPAVRTDEDDSKAIKEGKQDSSVADVTSTNSHVDTPNCDEKSVTVQITMSTLPADEVEKICRQCGHVTVFQFDDESHTGQAVFTDLASAERLIASVKEPGSKMCCSIKSNLSKKKQKKRKRRGREKISTKVLKREAAERIHIIFDSDGEGST